jgi:hypothetical protein
LKALQGVIPVELVVTYESGETKADLNEQIVSRIKDELMFSFISGQHGYFALMAPNASMVETTEMWVKKLNGVSDVHTSVLLNVVLNPNHYKSQSLVLGRESAEESSRVPTITR